MRPPSASGLRIAVTAEPETAITWPALVGPGRRIADGFSSIA
jgi:hypothetical protein